MRTIFRVLTVKKYAQFVAQKGSTAQFVQITPHSKEKAEGLHLSINVSDNTQEIAVSTRTAQFLLNNDMKGN